MVPNSFDLWQKDSFFSAAEEVQESADVMESTYRMWIKQKRNGADPHYLDQLSIDLQTALGTAKWQLEEFERAVRLSQGNHSDDTSLCIHKQFIAAIESQISHVDSALREALVEEGKQPFRWVDLDKEECDDLALFLSGTSQTPKVIEVDCNSLIPSTKTSPRDCHYKGDDDAINGKGFSSGVSSDKLGEFIIAVEERQVPTVREDTNNQADRVKGSRRKWNTANFGALKIVVSDEEYDQDKKLISTIESTPKEKGLKPLFRTKICGEHPHTKGAVFFSRVFGQVGGLQRQLQCSMHLRLNRTIQLVLALMLSIFLVVPFLVYST